MNKKIIFSMLIGAAVAGTPSLYAQEILNARDTASVLNRLIETSIDASKGYKEAAEQVASADLKARFGKASMERAAFGERLKNTVQGLGQDAEQTGSAAGAAFRAWVDMKTAVTKNDDKAVLQAVKTAEEAGAKNYEDALEKDLPQDIRKIVEKQSREINSTVDWINDRLDKESNKE